MNKKQTETRNQKMARQRLELRALLWPEIDGTKLWLRKERDGFTTIPRTLPLIGRIMDDLSDKGKPGKPVSSTYFALWCRVYDEGFVTIDNESELAVESGFGGERATSTWASRMKILQDLGFIDVKAGSKGPWYYVLILNPYHVIKRHYEAGQVQQAKFADLFRRAQEIKATDMAHSTASAAVTVDTLLDEIV